MKDIAKRSGKYLRELSVVVVGIVITFGLNGWIGHRSEQKEAERYLQMVKTELEENLGIVQEQFVFYGETRDFAKYLLSAGDQKQLQADSVAKYESLMRTLKIMTYEASAFEALKSSGAMRLIKDEELLKSIIDCYTLLERAKSIGDSEMSRKETEMRDIVREYGVAEEIFELKKPEYKPLFHYFSSYSAPEGSFWDCAEQIEKTLALF